MDEQVWVGAGTVGWRVDLPGRTSNPHAARVVGRSPLEEQEATIGRHKISVPAGRDQRDGHGRPEHAGPGWPTDHRGEPRIRRAAQLERRGTPVAPWLTPSTTGSMSRASRTPGCLHCFQHVRGSTVLRHPAATGRRGTLNKYIRHMAAGVRLPSRGPIRRVDRPGPAAVGADRTGPSSCRDGSSAPSHRRRSPVGAAAGAGLSRD